MKYLHPKKLCFFLLGEILVGIPKISSLEVQIYHRLGCLRNDNEINKQFLLFRNISSKGTTSQVKCCRTEFGRAIMKSLEKILRCYDMSIPTTIRITQAMIFTETIWKQKLDFKKE